jgi:beta-lactamase class D
VRRTVVLSLLWLVSLGGVAAADLQERHDLDRYFEAAGSSGTIVVRDVTAQKTIVYNRHRAGRPISPPLPSKFLPRLLRSKPVS